MDPAARRALLRLRDPDGGSLQQLARMVVDQTTATPLRSLAAPRWIAGQLAAALEAGTRGDHLRAWVDRRIASERARWGEEQSPFRSYVPGEAMDPLRKLLGRAYAPEEELLFRLIDQPAIRGLIRTVLADVVHASRRRLGEVDGMLGGLGKRAARRSRGLLGNVGKNLGGMAENIVGAVREEVDTALDGRLTEFLQGATSEAVRTIARYASDPAHAESFGQLRLAILDVVLDTPIAELAQEADKLQPEDIVDVVVGGIRAAVQQPDFVPRIEERIAAVMEEAGDGTLGAWLAEVGLADVWIETTTELVTERLRAVVETTTFETWWGELHRSGSTPDPSDPSP
ncbi:MAG TPA: hypothetical protein ENK18_09790 [Deltaproteobacteria bacterium]|nr:hypothetical protein [Deltaproteobacteria bacterium]